MPKYDIVCMGSSTVDVFAHTDPTQSDVVTVHNHKDIAYPLGAKILIREMHTFVGGGGTNTATAFSRLGLKSAYLGKIGLDDNGKTILSCLRDEKVDFIGKTGGISGYSVILDSVKDDRTIFTYKGCNDDLKMGDIDVKALDTSWMYLSSMMKESFITQEKVLNHAKKKGIRIAYNPSLYIVKNHSRHLRLMLKKVDILIFNKEEAEALLGNISDNVFTLLFEVAKLGPKVVVITDGHNGAHCYNSLDGIVYSAKPAKVHVVETTGAGDAFASGFVAGMMLGKSIDISLKVGMLNAESVIGYLGPKNILLSAKAFELAEHDNREIYKKKL